MRHFRAGVARSSFLCFFCLLLPALLFGADHPPRDHGGADLVLTHEDRIWGKHTNVGRFEVPTTATVYLHRYYPDIEGSGRLDVSAREIVVAGRLDGAAAGYTGGAGTGGRGVPNWDGTEQGRNGIDGKPRYANYAFPENYPLGGDGPAGGVTGQTAGGYNSPGGNTDTTTHTLVLMGSGGRAQLGRLGTSGDPNCTASYTSFASGGKGGDGGGPGGGAIRLFATDSLVLSGLIWNVGERGAPGTAGEVSAVVRLQTRCDWSACDGGNGGDGDRVLGTASGGGAGAGGGVVLFCNAENGLSLYTDTTTDRSRLTQGIETRGAAWRAGFPYTNGTENGGTIKIFYRGTPPPTTHMRYGRLYLRDLDQLPLEQSETDGWMVTSSAPPTQPPSPPRPRIGDDLIATRGEAFAALRKYERQGRQDAKPQGTD